MLTKEATLLKREAMMVIQEGSLVDFWPMILKMEAVMLQNEALEVAEERLISLVLFQQQDAIQASN